MDFTPERASALLAAAASVLGNDEPQIIKLQRLWLTLSFMQSQILAHDLRQLIGGRIQGGPFRGMEIGDITLGNYEAPMLLGLYEHELHPTVERIIADSYDNILNIGCSSGYYAVGLARRMPHVLIDAFDIEPLAQNNCARLAQLNSVADRVKVAGLFAGEDFARYQNQKTLALVDIEGEEFNLLDPVRYPALRHIDIVVEMHDVVRPNLSHIIYERFAPTHHVELIPNRNLLPDLTGLLPPGNYMDYIDQALLGWEGRGGPTPWGVFRARNS